MAYLSDIRMTCTKTDFDALCAAYRKLLEATVPNTDDVTARPLLPAPGDPSPATAFDAYEEHDGCVLFGWDNVRWYTGYDRHVQTFTSAMDEVFGDNADEHPYTFCRIGDDLADVECAYHIADALTITAFPEMTIHVNYD